MKGYYVVKNIEKSPESSAQDDDDWEPTTEECASFRIFLINDSREQAGDKAKQIVVGDQDPNGSFLMFNTTTGNEVIHGALDELEHIAALRGKANDAHRVDRLFMLMFRLYQYDCWIHDNEEWGEGGYVEQLILEMAKLWKEILVKTDAQLGIDAEYTRPAIEAQCELFAALTSQVNVPFEWC